MTEAAFRIKYSELIEYYQFIEMRLRFLCSDLMADEERGWFERLNDYELDTFGMLMHKLQELQTEKHITLLTPEDITALNAVRGTRNYWVHQCFGGLDPITFKNGNLNRSVYCQKVLSDLNDAIEWEAKLTEKAYTFK